MMPACTRQRLPNSAEIDAKLSSVLRDTSCVGVKKPIILGMLMCKNKLGKHFALTNGDVHIKATHHVNMPG